jgi:DNA repair exonuclease SbcCD nuclease subunit
VVEKSNALGADLLLIAGDVFEHNAVGRTLVRQVAELLAAFNGQVYLIPGNHDPLVPGSVWEHPAWSEKPNIHVLKDRTPVEVPGGWLYPCPLYERNSLADPTVWIDASDQRGVKIGIAHGTVEGVQQEEPGYPIGRNAAARGGLDYLALGHWHSVTEYPDPDGTVRMAYSGTHEPSRFGERDSGYVLFVTVDGPGAGPRIERVQVTLSATRRFAT